MDFLKGLLQADKLVGCFSDVRFVLVYSGRYLTSCVSASLQPSPTDKALANQFLAPGRTPTIGNERVSATKTVHMQAKGRCTAEMRAELLDTVRAHTHVRRAAGCRNNETVDAEWIKFPFICCVFAGVG